MRRVDGRFLLRLALGAALTLVFVLPLYWGAVASLRPLGLPPPPSVQWWPDTAQWSNYGQVFETLPFWRYVRNSLLVVLAAVPLTVVIASWAGFAMSQMPAKIRRWLILFSVIVLMIPGAAVWLFRYQILNWLGLLNTLWALIAPAFAGSNPLFVLLFYWTIRRIPEDTFEAARLAGASPFTIWWRLVLPLTRPTVIGVVVLTFVMYWSDFISPVLYIFEPEDYTVAVGLQILKQLDATNWPLLMAGAVMMTAPVVLLFVALQRFFLHDISLAHLFDRN